MSTPLLPYGAQARLQHSPPHSGKPPSMKPCGVQTWPVTRQPVVPGASTTSHTPRVAPAALLQEPPQHSKFEMQASPVCVQNEGWPAQMPPLQTLEQHSL